MSHSTTSGGVRRCRARHASGATRAGGAGHAAQRRAQVDPMRRAAPARCAAPAARAAAASGCASIAAPAASSSAVIVAKSLLLQHLARRERERRVELDLVVVRARASGSSGGSIACARRAGSSGAAPARRCARYTVGSSAAIIFSSSFGLRQKRSNACSNSGRCSCRDTSTAASAARKSSRLARPTASTASSASSTLRRADRQAGGAQHADEVQDVLGEASLRRERHGARQLRRARCRRAASQPDALRLRLRRRASPRPRGASAPTSSWYLSSTPSVSATVCGSSAMRSSAISASAQSSVSAMPGALNRSIARSRCVNATISRASASARLRALAADDRELAQRVGIVDPVVEAAPLDRVVDLARAVRRDDDDRRLRRADRAELGNRDLEVGQHFEQIRLERLVGAVELVDQQHRRDAVVGRERLQQRPLEQEARREDVVRELVAIDAAGRLGEPDLDHLPRVVPLVDRRRDVEAFVALQADELACRAPARAPWRSRSCRRPPRLRGTAAAAA